MFRSARINHVTVIVRQDKVDTLINTLFELGICQLKEADAKINSRYSYDIVKDVDEIKTRFDYVSQTLEDYKEITPPEGRLKRIFRPDPPKKTKSTLYSTKDIIQDVSYHLDLIEPKVTKHMERLHEIKEKIDKNDFLISNLLLIPDIKTEIFESSDNIKVSLGLISTSSLHHIKEKIKDISVISAKAKDKNQSIIVVLSLIENASEVEGTLHAAGFQNLEIPYENKKPMTLIQELRKEIHSLKEDKRKIENNLTKTHKAYEKKLLTLGEELRIARDKLQALKNFKTTQAFSVLEAWVPKKNMQRFHQIIKQISKQYYLEVDEKKDAPTLLKNPKLIEPFEMLTELYALPKYRAFDPTPILAITFAIFFGFMLTDVAYGLIVIALAWVMYSGIGKYNIQMKKFATILIVFGISTTIMGVVFGSYFGNFFQEIGINLPIPIDGMRQAMLTLAIALGIGSLHLLTALVSGFYENIYQGSIRSALEKQGVWILFMIGISLFLLKMNTAGLTLVITSVMLQMLFNFLTGGPVTSILSIFSFSGFIGDLFSYARLMALAIGTSGIALAVNFMVFMVIDLIPWAGIPIAVIVFIIGHLFNIAMNGLGAFVHSTRLHFLEFFSKFYEGGGQKYKPFHAERQNTYIKLEGGL